MAEHMPRSPQAARTWLDQQERADRKNARVIDKIRLALPRELDERQRAQLVQAFMEDLTKGRTPWYAAIHQTGRDAKNPHAHIVVRDRDIETGKRVLRLSDSAKDREKAGLEPKAVEWVRERWEHQANRALERSGYAVRIDRRTLEAQGIDRQAQIHVGPRAQHIDKAVQRPASRPKEARGGRIVDYPLIDAGRTRREANAQIIDLNLEKAARSPDFITRKWAQFEKEQRHKDRIVEDHLIAQTRRRTMEQRRIRDYYRKEAAQTRQQRQAESRLARELLRQRFAPDVARMKARHQWQRDELRAKQSTFAAMLFTRLDITGTTRRKQEAARAALSSIQTAERSDLAGQYRAARLGQLEAVEARYKPILAELRQQCRHRLGVLRDGHEDQERRAEAALQGREAERDQERQALQQAIIDWQRQHAQQQDRQAAGGPKQAFQGAHDGRAKPHRPEPPKQERQQERQQGPQQPPPERERPPGDPEDRDKAPWEQSREAGRDDGRGRARRRERPPPGYEPK